MSGLRWQKQRTKKRNLRNCCRKKHIDNVQLDIERGRKVGQIEVIPWRRGEVWGDGGRIGGGGGCSPETAKLETYDAQLGVQAGGWESSFGDSVWVVMRVGGWGGDCGSQIHWGRQEAGMTFGTRESYWGHWSIREWIGALRSPNIPPKAVISL